MREQAAQRVTGFLGLCTRAGQVTFGQDACVGAVRSEKAALVLLDEESSENSRKRFLDTCRSHATPLYILEAGSIARAVGKDDRKVVAIKYGTMADKLLALLQEEKNHAALEPQETAALTPQDQG